MIWREFLGDADANATNYVVEEASGRLFAIDLDKAFMGVATVKSSAFRDIMRLYATPGRVEPILHQIRQWSDSRLANLLDRLGPRHLSNWTPELRDEILKTLSRSRQALSQQNPYSEYYSLSAPWFVPLEESIQESTGDSRVRE